MPNTILCSMTVAMCDEVVGETSSLSPVAREPLVVDAAELHTDLGADISHAGGEHSLSGPPATARWDDEFRQRAWWGRRDFLTAAGLAVLVHILAAGFVVVSLQIHM